jgi:putative hydrolase of the HAD superfamily
LSPPIKTAPCDDAQSMISSPPRQTLLIDADDTLWENNIYFERAIASFISYLDHHRHAPLGSAKC